MLWKFKVHRHVSYWGDVPGPQGFPWKIFRPIFFDHLHCSRYHIKCLRYTDVDKTDLSPAPPDFMFSWDESKFIHSWRSDCCCDLWFFHGYYVPENYNEARSSGPYIPLGWRWTQRKEALCPGLVPKERWQRGSFQPGIDSGTLHCCCRWITQS